ncbi:MAG: LytTR family DNA-binding domain-containing protein [Bacteroidota bacterium]
MIKNYPFDPSVKHHFAIAFGLAVWIFVFLYFTEPLDVHEFGPKEKLIYLPFYGLTGAVSYILALPLQSLLLGQNEGKWTWQKELSFFLIFIGIALIVTRGVYLYIIVRGEPNPHTLDYFILDIYIPAILTILPIVIAGRWAFGKYKQKTAEDKKIEIPGDGTYEGLRLLLVDLIAIRADDNYIEVSYLENNCLKKQLIRNRLSAITKALPELLQTHRSHSINPYHFLQWKSENGKLFIILSFQIKVPVSKTFSSEVKARINSATK